MLLNHRLWAFVLLTVLATFASAQSGVVVFHEDGFPAADSAAAPDAVLHHALPGASFASIEHCAP